MKRAASRPGAARARRALAAAWGAILGLGVALACGCDRGASGGGGGSGSGGAAPEAGRGTGTGTAAPAVAAAPPLVFEPPSLDLGLLAQGRSASGTVGVRNVGQVPVTIAATRASCSCTYAQDLSGTVVGPGEAVEMTAELTPKPGLGNKHEQIRVVAQGYRDYVVLDIHAEVSLPVRAIPPAIEAARPDGHGGITTIADQGTVVVSSLDARPFRVIRTNGSEPQFVGFDPARDEPRGEYTLRWDLRGYTPQTIPWYWVVETDHPEAPVVDLRVQHEWTRNPQIKPRWNADNRLLGGVLRQGELTEVTTTLRYHPRAVPSPEAPLVRSVTPGIHAELVSSGIEANEVFCTIRVRVLAAGPGLLYERIEVTHGGYTAPVMFFAQLDG
jgi:hypothetical protein